MTVRRVGATGAILWLAALASVTSVPMEAQGTVSGQLTLAEPGSAARRDVGQAVV